MDITYNEIEFSIMSLKDFDDKPLARKVFEAIAEAGGIYFPSVYDCYEPLRRKCSLQDIDTLASFWVNEEFAADTAQKYQYAAGQILMERRRKPRVAYQMYWEKSQRPRFNYFIFRMDADYLKEPKHLQRYLSLCARLIALLEPVQGEIVNCSFPGWAEPIDLQVRHPELHWMNFFGKPYIELFGSEKLLTAPCYRVEAVANDVIALQLSECPFSPIPSDTRLAVKNHLNPDAFVEEGKSYRNYKTGITPEFDFSNVLFDKNSPPAPPQIRMQGTKE